VNDRIIPITKGIKKTIRKDINVGRTKIGKYFYWDGRENQYKKLSKQNVADLMAVYGTFDLPSWNVKSQDGADRRTTNK
jgi:hypothetical protein